jgi:flagellar biosynthesis protein FliQ
MRKMRTSIKWGLFVGGGLSLLLLLLALMVGVLTFALGVDDSTGVNFPALIAQLINCILIGLVTMAVVEAVGFIKRVIANS